jgi:hypothetical protein
LSASDENQDKSPDENKAEKESRENLFKTLDDLVSHTNSSRQLFLIFIGSALFFAPVALVLGGVLLEHPEYNIRHLEGGYDRYSANMSLQGAHLEVVSQNGTIIRDIPIQQIPPPHSPRTDFIFLGVNIFIIISIIFAGILLFIAIKEYRFFAKWNKRFTKFKSLQEKIDKELED